MPDNLEDVVLSRPEPAADAGPLDGQLYDLVEARFRRVIRDNPIAGTYYGIHTEDDRLGDGSRDALLAELAAEKAHLESIEALDASGLSSTARFERDLEAHNVRRAIFDTEVVRIWERRSLALDTVGDALFLDLRPGLCAVGRPPQFHRGTARGRACVSRPGEDVGQPCRRSGSGSDSRSSPPRTCRRSSTRSSRPGPTFPPQTGGG